MQVEAKTLQQTLGKNLAQARCRSKGGRNSMTLQELACKWIHSFCGPGTPGGRLG